MWVKYKWNGPPQPQMVGFRDLVGTDFALVSNKTAVKSNFQEFFLKHQQVWFQEFHATSIESESAEGFLRFFKSD